MSLLPKKFIENLYLQFDDETVNQLCACIEEGKKITSFRLNTLKPKSNFDKITPILWVKNGYYLSNRPNFALDPFFHAGCYYVQEASSMMIEKVFNQYKNNSGICVLDLCAAPGGKSTHIANLIDDESVLVSNEVIKSRYPILKENLTKWGATNVLLCNSDPELLEKQTNKFDWVVVDAPCSGEGLFRKNHKAINHWSNDSVQLCSARQKRILVNAYNLLKPGGFLLYSTCTYNTFENIDNVNWLIKEFGFESLPIENLEACNVLKLENENAIGYQAMPHLVNGEGFFMALLKKNEENFFSTKSNKKGKAKKGRNAKLKQITVDFLTPLKEGDFYENDKNEVFLLNDEQNEILKKSNGVFEVLPVGQFLKNKFIPNHFLSQTLVERNNFPKIELTKKQALQYLSKQEIVGFDVQSISGFFEVSYQQVGLGFGKAVSNRVNNYYPKNYRLRQLIK